MKYRKYFPVGNYLFFSDVLKCIVYEGIEENFKQKLLLKGLRFVFSLGVCRCFSRHWVAAVAQDWGGSPLALGCNSCWSILCLIKDSPVRQIPGKAKYRCNIPNSKHERPVWGFIYSCRCVCAMVRWLEVFLHTWRGQCVVEKELQLFRLFLPAFHHLAALCIGWEFGGVTRSGFFTQSSSLQTVNHDVV